MTSAVTASTAHPAAADSSMARANPPMAPDSRTAADAVSRTAPTMPDRPEAMSRARAYLAVPGIRVIRDPRAVRTSVADGVGRGGSAGPP